MRKALKEESVKLSNETGSFASEAQRDLATGQRLFFFSQGSAGAE